MKSAVVVLATLASVAVVDASFVGKVIGGLFGKKSRRDLMEMDRRELEDIHHALLTIRDHSFDTWTELLADPSKISAEVLGLLESKYQIKPPQPGQPCPTKGSAPKPAAGSKISAPIPRKDIIAHLQAGKPIDSDILAAMRANCWIVPAGLQRRGLEMDDFELFTRDLEEVLHMKSRRDAEPEPFEDPDTFYYADY
jgi:hypothetical protein